MKKLTLLLAIAIMLASLNARADCPRARQILNFVADFIEKRHAKAMPRLKTMFDAYCSQGKVAEEVSRHLGNIAGFKAGFTSKAMQEKFGLDGPVRGYLYENMFFPDGAQVPANFGTRPLYEADFIAIVKDEGLHSAKTPLEALQHISHVVPFIELPDLALAEDVPLTAINLVSINVGTRHGVLGTPVPVEATQEFLDRLANMTIIMTDNEGKELGRGPGTAMMDNPMNSVLWLAQDVEKNGMRIQAGDKLSLGSFIAAGVPKAGLGVKVQYKGLPGDPVVAVTFK